MLVNAVLAWPFSIVANHSSGVASGVFGAKRAPRQSRDAAATNEFAPNEFSTIQVGEP